MIFSFLRLKKFLNTNGSKFASGSKLRNSYSIAFESNKFCVKQNFESNKTLSQTKLWVKQILCQTKLWVKQNFQSNKTLSQRKFWVEQNFASNKALSQTKLWVKEILSQTNFESNKFRVKQFFIFSFFFNKPRLFLETIEVWH